MQDLMNIGIDTHGYDEPRDEPEFTYDEEAVMVLEEQIDALVSQVLALTDNVVYPTIHGYVLEKDYRTVQAYRKAERERYRNDLEKLRQALSQLATLYNNCFADAEAYRSLRLESQRLFEQLMGQ